MKIIIFGLGDFARQLKFYIEKDTEYEIAYFCVDKKYFKNKYFLGTKVITFEDGLNALSPREYKFILGVGYKNMHMRVATFNKIKEKGFSFANYVSSSATVLGEIIGEGNIILSNVTIEPFATVNNNNIIWSDCLICHDSIVGNHNFIAAKSILGGHSKVLENNFIGFNSTVIQNITVEKEVLLGANSLLTKKPENFSVYFSKNGTAKLIKKHEHTGICIE